MRDAYTVQYYDLRADEYEEIYRRDDPVRQGETAALAADMCEWLRGRSVLELACGTGFWTERLAGAAAHVVAIDAAPRMLAQAAEKPLPPGRVEFRQADAFALDVVEGDFNGGMANFFLSHVPRRRLAALLDSLCDRIGPGGRLFLADSAYIEGLGGELQGPDEHGDCYKLRTLRDGTRWRILKNYFDEAELQRLLTVRAVEVTIHAGACYWWARCTVR